MYRMNKLFLFLIILGLSCFLKVNVHADVREIDSIKEDTSLGSWYYYKNGGAMTFSTTSDNIPLPQAPAGTIAKGIDISKYDGAIDFSKLKNEVDFVIIRCGFGQNLLSQDDPYFEANVKGCRDNNIPYGIYIYSYALTYVYNQKDPTAALKALTTQDAKEAAQGEAAHALRLLRQCQEWGTQPSYPVFLDMEDIKQAKIADYNGHLMTTIAQTFCQTLGNAGYKAGIYANRDWFMSYLTDDYFKTSINWLARYAQSPGWSGNYAIWQCTSPEYSLKYVNGIKGAVDYDYMLKNISCKTDISKMTYSSIPSSYFYTGSAITPQLTIKTVLPNCE